MHHVKRVIWALTELELLVGAPTCSLSQCIRGNAWGHVGDGYDVAPRGGRRGGGGGASILDLDGEESLHVRVCLFLGDLLSSCSPWAPVFLWVTGGMHIFFSWMPRPTHGVLPLASWRQRFVSHTSWLRYGLTMGCGRGAGSGVHTWPCWPVSRCAEGCCCVCKQLSGSGEICHAATAGGGPVPQRSFLQSWDVWALAGLRELAHSITDRVGAVELFQYNIFLLRCCKDIMQEGSWNHRKTQSLDPFHYSGWIQHTYSISCSHHQLLLHLKSTLQIPFIFSSSLYILFQPLHFAWLNLPRFTAFQFLFFGLFRTCIFHSWIFFHSLIPKTVR